MDEIFAKVEEAFKNLIDLIGNLIKMITDLVDETSKDWVINYFYRSYL